MIETPAYPSVDSSLEVPVHSPPPRPGVTTQHLLTISLEDYFQVTTFRDLIESEQWERFDTRLESNTMNVLDLLDRFGVKATFFVLGWTAERRPNVVREVARRGHEIANKGYHPRSLRDGKRQEIRDNLARSRDILETITGHAVLGCRVPQRSFGPEDLWALDLLTKEGYRYDSSVMPLLGSFRSEPWRRFRHRHRFEGKVLWEFPLSAYHCCGLNFPIAGGNYMRQLPHALVKRLVADWTRQYDDPFVMYFHVWELDPDQVQISAVSRLTRIRHYRNLDRMREILEDYFRSYRFTSIADYMNLHPEPVSTWRSPARNETIRLSAAAGSGSATTPVAVVIPCYNEQNGISYLDRVLSSVEKNLTAYRFQYVFVDDGSTDETWSRLNDTFGTRANCKLVRHTVNQGVTRAILTGLLNAETEIVCSMDCDCSYEPGELGHMIPLLRDGVDLVTASPYHPRGSVRNLPGWRLQLSKAASLLYSKVLHQKLHTYTSCFRIYRKSSISGLQVLNSGFIGVAEIIGRLDLSGGVVVEHPATLNVRLIGHSKMKIIRTIFEHLRLLTSFAVIRFSGQTASAQKSVKLTSQKLEETVL